MRAGSIKKQVKKSRSVSPPSSRKNTHATSHNISSADRNSARQGLNSKITFDDRTESDEVSAMLLNGMHLNQDR